MSEGIAPESLPIALVDKVLARALETASHSWEYGVVFEAWLEYQHPSITVFNASVSQHQKHLQNNTAPVPALEYIKPHIRTKSTTLCSGHGSSADPASLGIPALLLHSLTHDESYLTAAQSQLTHLLTSVPRLPNGAISHREASASAWADFVYMLPPFLAYYGVFMHDESLVREAVRQCHLYRDVLQTASGLWMHIVSVGEHVSGERAEDDEGLWSTSNGWAAAGMTRVLATVRGAGIGERMREEQRALVEAIEGIVCGAMEVDKDGSGLLRNYLDDATWWGEVAGTALLTAIVFRMAVLEPCVFGETYTNWALRKIDAVSHHIDKETGVAAPVVNALKERQRVPLKGTNPEGQAFVVLMYAAWRDWKVWTQPNLL
ncbi:hypothetical protein E8E13_008952 [Curvularia kusanoi]|uniref:Uncharacterized protein n=1 Tax=Curvularia kusanoi TaxID=90978 RepID=A0A9P4WBJ5_CURKU|nr:hypothetical protein E8E13_008952 [Curvularia kusanoi]